MNKGTFTKHYFIKYVEFSKAVLWKDKQLSLPVSTFIRIQENKTQILRFVDLKKSEVWDFLVDKVNLNRTLKKEGQEPQYYFPITLAVRSKYVKDKFEKEINL